MDNVIGSYSDKDGVSFLFVNDGMNTTPTDATVQIKLADGTPITDEIADVWGFGFVGEVRFENGSIVASTDTPLSAKNHVTILFNLDKGILSPSRQESDSFEGVQKKAFEGSDYDDIGETGEEVSIFTAFIVTVFFMGLPIGLIIWTCRIKKKIAEKKWQRFFGRFGYFRELPNEGNLSATYTLGRMFDVCDDGVILAAGMLRLIQLGLPFTCRKPGNGFYGQA